MAIPVLSSIQTGRVGASLFYKKDKRTVGGIEMDLLLSESIVLESEVAEHPIENGSEIATHIRNKLRSGSLVGLISNWSLTTPTTGGGVANRAADTLAALTELWYARKPVTITTSLWQYVNAVITNISAKRDGETGDAQSFEITFKEIKLVEIKKVAVDVQTDVGSVKNDDSDSQVENKKQASAPVNKGAVSGSSGSVVRLTQDSTTVGETIPVGEPALRAQTESHTTSGIILEDGFYEGADGLIHKSFNLGG